jgi:hypothetical protein
MKFATLAGATLVFSVILFPAMAADDVGLTRLALCQDSWVDWQKSDPAKLNAFAARFRAQFTPHDNDPYFLPKAKVSVLGMNVPQVFPESIGMAVGFSLTVDAKYDDARKAVEKALGKPLKDCEASDGMKTCALELAPQHDVTIMAEDSPAAHQTLIGCYYFYEK